MEWSEILHEDLRLFSMKQKLRKTAVVRSVGNKLAALARFPSFFLFHFLFDWECVSVQQRTALAADFFPHKPSRASERTTTLRSVATSRRLATISRGIIP